jgi:DNA-directed RNA polymerase subunit M/transcription elongation factor TFIIS
MDNIDQAAEWQRLQELYRQMSEDELQVVADQAYDLTDIAREVLRTEITARGVEIALAERPELEEAEAEEGDNPNPAEFNPDDYELWAAERVWDRAEAEKYKKIYDDAGVASYIGPDLVEKVEDYKGNYEQGVEIKVRYLDRNRAILAVRYAFRDEPPVTPEEEARETDYRCPKCNSDEIVFDSLEKESPDRPDYLSKFNWTCEACGHDWTDDGVEKDA